jgi:hypothetical protein
MEKSRAEFLESFKKRMVVLDNENKKPQNQRFPLLTLTEFFSGNIEEESIAPNQWGYERPTLAEIWARMREVEARPDVEWVRVVLHSDTIIREYEGAEVCEIAGDTIAICTTAEPEDIEHFMDYESLQADGVHRNFEPKYSVDIPNIPEGYQVLVLVWD